MKRKEKSLEEESETEAIRRQRLGMLLLHPWAPWS